MSEVVAVSIGPEKCQDVLRQTLALGVDRGILVKTGQIIQHVNQVLKLSFERLDSLQMTALRF